MENNDITNVLDNRFLDVVSQEIQSQLRLHILILNQELNAESFFPIAQACNGIVICADGGANHLWKYLTDAGQTNLLNPDYIVGDLDSLDQGIRLNLEQRGTIVLEDKDQDSNDFEKSLRLFITKIQER